MDFDWQSLIALVAGVTALVTSLLTRRKANAEADTSIANTAMDFVKTLKVEMQELREENVRLRGDLELVQGRVAQMEKENVELRAGIALLCSQVTVLGQVPIYKPVPAANK